MSVYWGCRYCVLQLVLLSWIIQFYAKHAETSVTGCVGFIIEEISVTKKDIEEEEEEITPKS